MRSPNTGVELRQLDGTAADIVTRATALKALATRMETTATHLKNIGSSSIHKSKGTDKLAEMANETYADLADAAVRYRGTGTALATYGEALDVAQTWLRANIDDVERAENSYQTALADKAEADHLSLLAGMRAQGSDDDADARAATRADSAAEDAATSLQTATNDRTTMWQAFDGVFETWSEAYDDAVDGIESAIETAGNNDGFWEFVDDVLQVIAIVLVVLSVIALVIGAPLTGLLAGIIFALAAASFLLTTLKFAYGRASLSDVAWSAVGLLPFGVGKLLARGVPTLATVVQGGRGVVTAAIRAGLPRVSLLRPTTWVSPVRSLFAPVRSWLALPKPGMFTNPFAAIRMGGAETSQISTFLNTMRGTPWATNPGVQQFISSTTAALPGGIRQAANVITWGGFSTVDLLGLANMQPQIPGLRDVRVG
ncbi:hypothetical protein JOD63_002090 [Microbacterium terrae]|uniref:Uncharacterized protein n=1 Tax=Microbacterium terrae TaxID=69369 RepID=A0A0M2H005_9MICO|nr:hypothetical protein [Microbacterium terrae]KJL39530.1 hypothetical protein RS81_01947 [Microbacterium terrae]MBP1078122.1 hypothetical protein [Microbacterium terrae]GLJ97601.1 hypothetical protein GCM10017594_07980 [Microbacterium terrae]